MDDYIAKPLMFSDFLTAIEKWLVPRRTSVESPVATTVSASGLLD
jgi:hypothetical protein